MVDTMADRQQVKRGWLRKVPRFALNTVWYAGGLVWPLLRWVLAIDVTFQFARMVWLWGDPSANVGWTFLAHYGLLIALMIFFGGYNPSKPQRTEGK